MKLYTEEQLLNTVKAVIEYDNEVRIEKHLKALQPIELPSDEEIRMKTQFATNDFYWGAKWMKEQILNQNK